MDKRDKKIINALLLNSRIPFSKIAKQIRISKELLSYRINKLIKNYNIEFLTLINVEKLGFKTFSCLLELTNADKNEELRIIKELSENKDITNISRNIGKWNIIYDIYAEDVATAKKIQTQSIMNFKPFVEQVILIQNIKLYEIYFEKFFDNNYHYENKKIKNSKNIQIDSIDKRILFHLSKNSREDLIAISKKLNLSPNTIKYRIKKLEKENVILRYTINIDFFSLGYQLYNIQFKLKKDLTEEITNYLKNHPSVFYIYNYEVNVEWYLDIGLLINDVEILREFILDFKRKFPNTFSFNNMHIITELSKAQLPENVFE